MGDDSFGFIARGAVVRVIASGIHGAVREGRRQLRPQLLVHWNHLRGHILTKGVVKGVRCGQRCGQSLWCAPRAASAAHSCSPLTLTLTLKPSPAPIYSLTYHTFDHTCDANRALSLRQDRGDVRRPRLPAPHTQQRSRPLAHAHTHTRRALTGRGSGHTPGTDRESARTRTP